MFFTIFLCFEILHCYTGLNGDPTIVENCCIELDLVPQTNREISIIIKTIDSDMLPWKLNELASVISYYIEYVKKYTNSVHHKFLTRFICLIVYIIHQKNKTEPIVYKTELLFNILSFAKLYEYNRCNKEMNDIEKARIVSLFKTGMKRIEYIHESLEIRTHKIEIDYLLTIKNIETSCDLNSDLDFKILDNTYVVDERNIESDLSNYLKSGSFEQTYSFYLYLKLDFLLKNREELNYEVIIFPLNQIFFNKDFFNQLLDLNLSLTKDLSIKFDQVKYKKFMMFISEPYINTVLNQSSSFDSIFEFSEKTFFSKNENISKEFPEYLLEFFIEKQYENQIDLIYGFLDDISTPQFNKYILLVLCLKFPCFNQNICNKEILLRIILECIFLTNILSPEIINVKGLISGEILEINLFQILEQHLQNQNIKIKIPIDRKALFQRYIPETFKFLENMAPSNLKPVFVPILQPESESQPEQETATRREPAHEREPKTKREPETIREPASKHAFERAPKAPYANKPLTNVHKKENSPNPPPNTKVVQKNNGTNPENLTETTRSSKLKKQESKILESETESKRSEAKPQEENNAFRTILIVVLVFTSVIGISATGYWIYLEQLE
ncbi:hypothetical protein CWI38_0337p0010 [Hamiltosporidium tvaerminnensis]|uniref:Uncharacterized protein n=1 Tax=Hamiltosporidium tvaerminnensis TaxID=1176355 RepID=A0A4Q9LY69_9MICR|nr:hypothetical protein CWI38_0337p0010 [Hamiltosporidium tvaerminnensis]